MTKPVVLCILDGWGNTATETGNAPALAKTPNFDRILRDCPNAQLITHGPDAGLPSGQMGNSEVGHTNIGAGRVVAMDLGQIDLSIENGSYRKNQAILDFANTVKGAGGTAHLVGLVSDGGVHGHITHINETIDMLADLGVPTVLHAITDGRDVAPKSAADYFPNLSPKANVGTITGRFYALDRDNRWDRVTQAFDVMVMGFGAAAADTPTDAIEQHYGNDLTDEFFPATSIGDYDGMADGDGLFCLNFRADRAREILAALAAPEFDDFDVSARPEFSATLGMVSYSADHDTYMQTAFPKRNIPNTLGEWVSAQGLRQFRVAETEKYPHVTFFLNGGVEPPYPGEDRIMPPSPKVATYDMQPEMSAAAVTDHAVGAITDGYDLVVINFANPDMVGHTGDLTAAITACEAVDDGLGQILRAVETTGGAIVVTADHGNCEMMIDPETGGPHTAHTTNLVPVIVAGAANGTTLRDGRLADLAPTILRLMGLDQPTEMTGQSLI